MHFRRMATQDTEIAGRRIEAGQKVVIWYTSADYDDEVFIDPYRFDIARSPNDHVAFAGRVPTCASGPTLPAPRSRRCRRNSCLVCRGCSCPARSNGFGPTSSAE